MVAEDRAALGVIQLKDIIKGGMVERFNQMRQMGIKTVMITGDNPLTAATIAREAGVDDFLAQATPEDKMALIKREQAGGKLVAMTGDGTNDAPALAQADVGVAMNTGTQAAKEAGNMVDLDSNPTKLIEIVEIGKQLLDDARCADYVLDCQRRGEVLCDYSGNVCHALAASVSKDRFRAEHHGSAYAAVSDSLGRNLQRGDHHCADSAGAARGEVSPDECCVVVAAQSADLRPGRNYRAVHRHQDH